MTVTAGLLWSLFTFMAGLRWVSLLYGVYNTWRGYFSFTPPPTHTHLRVELNLYLRIHQRVYWMLWIFRETLQGKESYFSTQFMFLLLQLFRTPVCSLVTRRWDVFSVTPPTGRQPKYLTTWDDKYNANGKFHHV